MTSGTAADALCVALAREGVEVVFGHPGGAILPFYDALFRAGRPLHVLVRHEQAAAHAADGYARATGRVGVCVATSGPGATNLVTGLATALMDSVPLVAVTGQVPRSVMGTEAFQETDILGVTMPVTKHGFLVERPEDLAAVVAEAFRIARSRRPGPVLVDIPKDVQNAPCDPPLEPPGRAGNGLAVRTGTHARPAVPPAAADFERAARLLAAAERPLILAGHGVVLSRTTELVHRLAESLDAPVSTTLLGLDGFAAGEPRAVGMPGMHGTERANRGIQAADLIVGLGLRFDDRVIGAPTRFAPNAAIVHLDIDPVCVGRTVRPEVRLIGCLSHTLPRLLARLKDRPSPKRGWWAQLDRWSRDADPGPDDPGFGPLTGRAAVRRLARHIGQAGAIVATDVGQHQMWLAQELPSAAPGSHLTSGGLGAMGYALPAAFGAAVGRPDRKVWVVAGDGGFQMTLQELATVTQERVPLRIAVVNNGFLGMVRQWQELFYARRYAASELSGPDLVRLAGAYGILARSVDRIERLEPALTWAEAQDGAVLLDLRVAREENVYPMVPAGAALDEMVMPPAGEAAVA